MGLDAKVGDHYSMRMGSYSSIQTQRRKLIELAIEYCKMKDAQLKEAKHQAKQLRKQEDEQVQKDEDTMDSSDNSDSEYDEEFDDAPNWQSILVELKTWIAPQSHMMIMLPGFETLFEVNYPNILASKKDDLFAEAGLLGLKWFVNHSDSDGYWSPGQSMDILLLLKELQAHKLVNPMFNDEDNPYFELLEASVTHKMPVTFC
uniref:Uncharacterized protein n=1 Tax=Clandestinovirus TaxID=2831644 RepID=A0A8F8KLD5_9VIRU|nr:hypothetical protein KOM_12_570 [Clandestinovirus]